MFSKRSKLNFIYISLGFLALLTITITLIYSKKKTYVIFPNGARVQAEVANTLAKQQKGLSQRKTLHANQGMLFVFDNEGTYPFWMKDMEFPIDIIWLNSKLSVIYISENLQPCSANVCPIYQPPVPIKYVLEVNARFSKENNLKVGDVLKLK